MKWWSLAFIALFLCASVLPCLAGVPYDVDDAGTPEVGHFEINLAYVSSQARGSEFEQVPNIEVNYGYDQRTELVVDIGASSIRNTGEQRQWGLDDTTLETKWRFQDETKNKPQVALDYAIKIPTAKPSLGLGTGKVDHSGMIIAEKNIGRYDVFGNVGYNLLGSHDEEDNLFWGVATAYQLSEQFLVGPEVYGNTASAPGEHQEIAYGFAVQDTYEPDRTLMFAIGRSTEGFSDLNIYAGIQIVTGAGQAEPDKGDDTGKNADNTGKS